MEYRKSVWKRLRQFIASNCSPITVKSAHLGPARIALRANVNDVRLSLGPEGPYYTVGSTGRLSIWLEPTRTFNCFFVTWTVLFFRACFCLRGNLRMKENATEVVFEHEWKRYYKKLRTEVFILLSWSYFYYFLCFHVNHLLNIAVGFKNRWSYNSFLIKRF